MTRASLFLIDSGGTLNGVPHPSRWQCGDCGTRFDGLPAERSEESLGFGLKVVAVHPVTVTVPRCPKCGATGLAGKGPMAMKAPPLTDEDLARFERCLPPRDPEDGEGSFTIDFMRGGTGVFDSDDALRLVAEVRRLRQEAVIADQENEEAINIIVKERETVARLRSDEWLQRASEEIVNAIGDGCVAEDMVAIFRKHRDGKA